MNRANVSGQACAFMAMTPIALGEEPALRAYLEGLREQRPLARSKRTHFARWVIVPHYVDDAKQRHKERLGGPYLVFTSNFDGPLDSYLDELVAELADEAREIWGRCVGAPQSAADLKRYLLHNQIDTGFFYAAYPTATVVKVRAALENRDLLIDFALRAQSMPPEELREAFLAEHFR